MRVFFRAALAALGLATLFAGCTTTPAMVDQPAPLRVATYNVSLYAEVADGVRARLAGGHDAKARHIAAVIQRQRPDLLLLNEFDYDAKGALADVFQREYLEVGQHGEAPIHYPYRYFAPVNTGEPSGMDLNGDGRIGGPGRLHGEDAFGYGLHPGQYGMLVLSRHPIDTGAVRTFQTLPWSILPNARRPKNPATGRWWYDDAVWPKLRLSSKSHWDVPVQTPDGVLHFLVSHPTPPVFDGPEDRNGLRNADELTLWRHYLDDRDADWLCDDQGRCGGLPAEARFVIAGDLNNDPTDGDGHHEAIVELIEQPRVLRHAFPTSEGGVQSARERGGANLRHRGNPAQDTSQFGGASGNLHLDFVLPSVGLQITGSGVFWPLKGQPGADWVGASDHRMVWLDLELADTATAANAEPAR
jgi:endonuclease/exonuclease/phosphatase family metal-dependent hydrolase